MRVKNGVSIFFFFLLFKTAAQFQDKNYYIVDSLVKTESNQNDFAVLEGYLKEYHQVTTDTQRLNLLSFMVESVNDENVWIKYNRLLHNKSIHLANRETDPLLKRKYLSKKAQAINNFGFYLQNYTSQPETSLNYYRQAEKIQIEINDKPGLIISKNNIANYLYNTGDVLQALNIFHETIKIQEELKNVLGLTPLLNNLAETYMFLGDTAKAYVYLKRALASSIQSGNKQIIAQELQNVGVLASYQGQKQYALDCITKAMRIRENIGDVVGLCKSKLNLATFCLKDQDFSCAKRYLDEVKPIAEKTDNLTLKYLFYSYCGQFYESVKDYKNAEQFHQTALHLAEGNKSVQDEIKSINFLLKLYKSYDSPMKELEVHRKKTQVDKIVNTNEIRRTALQKEYAFEYAKKEQDLKTEQKIRDEKNKSEKRKQTYIIAGISIILAITLIFFVLIYKAFTRIREKNKIISRQKNEVEKSKQLVEHKQKEILDSIKYAKRIQQSLLTTERYIDKSIRSLKKD